VELHLVSREKTMTYLLYRGVLTVLGSVFAVGSFLVLIWVTMSRSPIHPFWGFLLGGIISALSVWIIAKGFSRQWFHIYEEGFIPFWKGFLDSRQRSQTLVPWKKVIIVCQMYHKSIRGDWFLSEDIVFVRNGQGKVVGHVINRFSMRNYKASTMEMVRRLSGEHFKLVRAKSFPAFERYLRERGIDPKSVDYRSGEFEVPVIPG